MKDWFVVSDVAEIPSPALLLYPDRIGENIRRMIQLAGGVARLRPHIKTHKLAELVQMQLEQGITQFKCATIAEAEMTAAAGARDVLLAYPPVGPNIARMVQLVRQFPEVSFAGLADDVVALQELSNAFAAAEQSIGIFLDIDCGQHRTGIEPGAAARELYHRMATLPGLVARGLHVYDGHLQMPDPGERKTLCERAFAPADALRRELQSAGLPVPTVVAGGTPTFPIHAKNPTVQCSPGTCVLWDWSYHTGLADLDFLFGALVLTRVVSKPIGRRLCVDLGHKAIAAENPHPRVHFLNLSDATAVSHSEEHLVLESPRAGEFAVGDCLYGVPRHICPTVALFSEATVIQDGRATERWRITARERRLTI